MTTRRKCVLYGCLTPVVVIAFLLIGLVVADRFLPSKARRALPRSATDVHEYYTDSGFTGDFVRVVKARLPESDFRHYALVLGLTEKYDPSVHGPAYDTVAIEAGGAPGWWDEPSEMDNCHFRYTPGERYVVRVKWKDGWVYFLAIAW